MRFGCVRDAAAVPLRRTFPSGPSRPSRRTAASSGLRSNAGPLPPPGRPRTRGTRRRRHRATPIHPLEQPTVPAPPRGWQDARWMAGLGAAAVSSGRPEAHLPTADSARRGRRTTPGSSTAEPAAHSDRRASRSPGGDAWRSARPARQGPHARRPCVPPGGPCAGTSRHRPAVIGAGGQAAVRTPSACQPARIAVRLTTVRLRLTGLAADPGSPVPRNGSHTTCIIRRLQLLSLTVRRLRIY